VAQFDPQATPPVIPLPNDLVRDPATGLLAIPDLPGASDAQKEFNAYLRTLDGFPPSTPVTASFSDALNPESVTPSNLIRSGAVAVFDLTAAHPLSPADFDLVLSDDRKTLTVKPH